jgi:hypothetical protein
LRFFIFLSTLVLFGFISSCGIDYDFSNTILARDFHTEMDENPEEGAAIGKISASSSYGRMEFEIEFQQPEGAFAVTKTKGELSVLDAALFDYETDSVIVGSVIISNNQMADTIKVKIKLADVPE